MTKQINDKQVALFINEHGYPTHRFKFKKHDYCV